MSVSIITICCILFVKPEPLCLSDEKIVLDPKRTILYLMLFALSIVIVFRGIPYWIGLIVIPAVLLIVDRKALKMVDYGLLFTFVFFFIFAGNMARIDVVRDLFGVQIEISDTMDVPREISALLQARNPTAYSPETVKRKLNKLGAPRMTMELLHSRDPADEVIGWLREISEFIQA